MNIIATPERIVLPNQTRKSVIYKDEKGNKYIRKQCKYVKLQKGGLPLTGLGECTCCFNACIFTGMSVVGGIAAFVIIACLLDKCSRRSDSRRIQPVSSTPRQFVPVQQQLMTRRTGFTTPDAIATINLDDVNNLVNDPEVIKVLQHQTGANTMVLEEKLKKVLGGKEGFNKLQQLLMSSEVIKLGVSTRGDNKLILNPVSSQDIISVLEIDSSRMNITEQPIPSSMSSPPSTMATNVFTKIKDLFSTSCKVHPSAGGKSKPKKIKSK